MYQLKKKASTSNTLSEKLTDFVTNLKYEAIQDEALKNAKYHVLDTIGISIAASTSDTAQTVKNVMRKLGTTSESTVIGSQEKFSAAAAAMANSTMAHGPDFDDTHGGSVVHVSSVVVPASLAVAESVKASGKDYLTAVMAGYEVTNRLGMVAPGNYHARGFHTTALLGGFGSAVMTGKLKGLSPSVITHALGICGSQASGIIEFLSNGSSLKQMQPGWSAYSGIIAAMLAEEGMTGPLSVFEGRYGFFNSYLYQTDHDQNKVLEGLNEVWEVNDIAYKLYPCCHHTQAFLDCTKQIRNEEDFRLEEIEEIKCIISPKQAEIICSPLEEKYEPKTPYDAKFSLPYVLSVMLHRGQCGLGDFTGEIIKDESVLRLARKFTYITSEETGYPGAFPGWVKIKLKDGRVLERRMKTNRGGRENPASEAEIIGKFENNASSVLSSDKVSRIKELVLNVEKVKDVSEITKYMQA
ncbi:MmgE/PrpD family protein [Peribacillus aracenensis]|uniref:MmgE/PrpD family protein n=1 Tax=Peribacillus aracenensis TaxID=2976708 RepID=UPI0021A36583|nr:MmgE/PrpD family protein [Peribacillus sp. BBB004]